MRNPVHLRTAKQHNAAAGSTAGDFVFIIGTAASREDVSAALDRKTDSELALLLETQLLRRTLGGQHALVESAIARLRRAGGGAL